MKNFDSSPKIINSKVNNLASLGHYSNIIDSTILANSTIYKDTRVVNSIMEKNTFAGDGAKVDNSHIENFARVGKYNHIYFVNMGKHSYTGQDTVIMYTKIGAFTSISWGVTIGAAEHDFSKVTSHTFLYNSYDQLNNDQVYYDRFEKECRIGNDVWIGANSTVLRGVTIGDGAVIGANSIVTKSVPPYAIVAGNPARIIKYRFGQEIITRLLKLKWWTLDDEIIKQNCDLFAKSPDNEVLNNIEKIINS
ncbi:CatB-related O-acetyltransferase [Peribacillus simplex]|uniref:CatB-related O-acetyltransferase n=1 Tax=Peribacillus simplex TaxID=1478 RepID=UPI0024C154D8|nr:CatB-related O-acetyltransferase [Peribacillus simplex]WHY55226.1 CatB-related O-acetyltransferase [Peribacillus simplex]